MRIIEDYEPYRDSWGLIQDHPGNVSGNAIRYTAEYVIALHRHNLLDLQQETLVKTFKSIEKVPGLIMRTPTNFGGHESIDDNIAYITAGYFLKTNFAKDWLKYGRSVGVVGIDDTEMDQDKVSKSKLVYSLLSLFGNIPVGWTFNNISPDKFHVSSWYGRFQQLIAHAQFAAGETVPLWRQLLWAASLISKAYSDREDAKVLGWHMVQVAKGKTYICDKAIEFFNEKIKEEYPQGIGQIIAEEFSNPEHPSAVWLKNQF